MLPVYEVEELTLEEALMVFAVEKEMNQAAGESYGRFWSHAASHHATESVAA